MKHRVARTPAVILLILTLQAALILPAFGGQPEVRETVLPNGLKAITKEVHAAPVVTFAVWYKVGSRNEQLGKTGLSHLLEHMQFKGTTNFKKGEIDRLIKRNGGYHNGATWRDFTFYFQTLSSDRLELAMRIESDRMVNSLIDPKELEAEQIVVQSELEGDENDPDSLVYDELYSLAFESHPYMWPVIGRRRDVESVTRADIYGYYRTFYNPNNATVLIVGDFDTGEALTLVRKYFGKIPRGPEPPKVTAEEEEQLGERRARIQKAGAAYRVMMGYHTPAVGHPGVYTLDVIEIILSSGTSSRLYKALVDKQLATSVWASASISKDPDLFILGATARDGVSIEDVEAALLAEVERLKSEPVSDEELQKALNQLEAHFVYANDSVSNQARQLGYFETIHSWRFVDRYLGNVRRVTKADIRRVAGRYFTKKNRTVVTFVPEQPKQQAAASSQQPALHPHRGPLPSAGEEDTPAARYAAYRGRKSSVNGDQSFAALAPALPCGRVKSEIRDPKSEIKPTRTVLDNGLVVIIHENRSNPTVGIQGSLNAGSTLDPAGKSGMAQMTADLLIKGTSKRTADQIAAEKDFVGASLSTGAEVESASFSGYALSKHLDLLLDLLSDVLRNPTFPAEEFEKLKARRLSRIKQERDSPQALAFRAFHGNVFPKGHAYHQLSVDEELADTSAITHGDVLNFYRSHYGPETAVLVVVGDVDTQEAVTKIKSYFGDWKRSGAPERPRIPDVPLQAAIAKKVIAMPDKSQVDVILGYSGGLKRSDPDFYAAMVMNFVLGGGGALSSRLGDVLRDQMGLVYNVYSTFDATLGAGPWYAKLGTNRQNVDKAVKALTQQIALMRDEGAAQQEVEEAIDFITGSLPVRLEKNSSIANILWAAEFYGLGMDYIQNYQKLYRSVTLEQINAAARKYLHPDRYTLVIAGPYEEADGRSGKSESGLTEHRAPGEN